MATTINSYDKLLQALQGLYPDGVPKKFLPGGIPLVTSRTKLAEAWQGDECPTVEELRKGLSDYEAARDMRVELSGARAALRDAWMALPPFIRGPFDSHFRQVERLLDEGEREAARAVVEYAEPPEGYSEVQKTTFATVQLQMLAGIDALPNV